MLDDVRYALRGMLRSPGFTAVALLMIALGTGANAAMFSVIDGVMLQSPFTDPDRIGILGVVAARRAATACISIPQYRSLAASPGPFEAVAAMGGGTRPMIAGLGEPRRFKDECVTAGLFRGVGSPPSGGPRARPGRGHSTTSASPPACSGYSVRRRCSAASSATKTIGRALQWWSCSATTSGNGYSAG